LKNIIKTNRKSLQAGKTAGERVNIVSGRYLAYYNKDEGFLIKTTRRENDLRRELWSASPGTFMLILWMCQTFCWFTRINWRV